MHIGEPFRDVSGILSGVHTFVGMEGTTAAEKSVGDGAQNAD
jgi:hypothetical protein